MCHSAGRSSCRPPMRVLLSRGGTVAERYTMMRRALGDRATAATPEPVKILGQADELTIWSSGPTKRIAESSRTRHSGVVPDASNPSPDGQAPGYATRYRSRYPRALSPTRRCLIRSDPIPRLGTTWSSDGRACPESLAIQGRGLACPHRPFHQVKPAPALTTRQRVKEHSYLRASISAAQATDQRSTRVHDLISASQARQGR